MQKILAILLGLCLALRIYEVYSENLPNAEALKSKEIPPCAVCKIVADSFEKGLGKTSHGKFEGGKSALEAQKLGSYSKSEIRLTEIQKNLCMEVREGQAQCHALATQQEHVIQEWWKKHQNTKDLYTFLCIESTKRCCPVDRYGPNCSPCPGFPNNICNKNGKCKGAGTRKGNGLCSCDQGYIGDTCSQCASGFYESFRDHNVLLCSNCHTACDGPCTGSGPKDCEKCNKGWKMVGGQGCIDINECAESHKNCPGNQFCINKDGDYSCLACDKACKGCSGDGPDMCVKCAVGYKLKDNLCVNVEDLGRKKKENVTRYATYLGLCISICIIMQRNIVMAGAIGFLVAVYITISEYMICHTHLQDNAPTMDMMGPVI